MQLIVESLSKNYRGGVQALRGVQLPLSPGVLGLLGPNGAGKSTLMRILATITQPSSGRVLWNGADIASNPDALRSVLGYLPQDFGVYPNLSAIEFLEYLAAVKGVPAAAAGKRIAELLELVNLADAAPPPRRLLRRYAPAGRHRASFAQRSTATHRRRTYRRARPRRTRPLSQSALRTFRRTHRHSLHAHRLRRRSCRHQHRHSVERPATRPWLARILVG
jgi:ABC-type transport system involved in cytochrome c biogenesis ATPase subunit